MSSNKFLRLVGFAGYSLLIWGLVSLAKRDGLTNTLLLTILGTTTVITCTNLSHSSRTKELEERLEQLIDSHNTHNDWIESRDNNFDQLNQNDLAFNNLLTQYDSKTNQFHNALYQLQTQLDRQSSTNRRAALTTKSSGIDEDTINSKLYQLESKIIEHHNQFAKSLNAINRQLNKHVLVKERNESHNLLIKVLGGQPQIEDCNQFSEIKPVQHCLILVCPWITEYVFGNKNNQTYALKLLENLLERGVNVHIGYGYIGDINIKYRDLVNAENYLKYVKESKGNIGLNTGLESMIELSKKHRNLTLKFICSHEKYLISDNNFAVYGSHNFLSSMPREYTIDRESAILTYDRTIINLLIQRYINTEEIKAIKNKHTKPEQSIKEIKSRTKPKLKK